jgi:transcriptional regulator with XRE-family HTH domain
MFTETKDFAKRLAKALGESPLSARKIAAAAGVSPAYLSDLANGKKACPSPHIIKWLAAALQVSKAWLSAGEGPMKASEREAALWSAILAERQHLENSGEQGLSEQPAQYHVSAAQERLHREIMERLNDACLGADEQVQQQLKTRIDEYIESRKPRRLLP